jgi:peptide/nickel transport system ATP-binding protein
MTNPQPDDAGTTTATEPLLALEDVSVTFRTEHGEVTAIDGVSFEIYPGETVAVVGESGSGKSTAAAAVIGLLAENGQVSTGHIRFDGQDIAGTSESKMRALRGTHIGMVPQDPMSNLNPVLRIGTQLEEGLEDNQIARGEAARRRSVELLEEAGLGDAARRTRQYPHEFSGGMRQRALIAMGLSCRPKLLIADEPTSALDVTVQQTILDHLEHLTSSLGTAVMLITHDLGLAAERASRIVVMYRGKVVETGSAAELLANPQHEYTRRLVAAAPSLASRRIEATKHHEPAALQATDVLAHGPDAAGRAPAETEADNIISVRDVSKVFTIRSKSLFKRPTDFTAVDHVSLDLPRGQTVAVVGESGSGKSTLARMVLDLETPTSGEILFNGQPVGGSNPEAETAFRRRVQPIFQDPYASLDPLFNIYRTIEEPLKAHGAGDAAARGARVRELVERVSLPANVLRRYPSELSGGQRQRVAIARALALNPDVVVCDEAVSALDVIVQAQILQLLADLQQEFGLSYLFITHDLAVVRQIADRVCVMEKGRIVESGPTDSVFDNPQQEYTVRLLESIPGRHLDLAGSVSGGSAPGEA